MTSNDIIQLAFTIYKNPGVFALLIGSGVSRAAEIPTGWEIIGDLASQIAKAKGEEPVDPYAWYRQEFDEEPAYDKILERLARSPAERNSILRGYFEPTEGERERGTKQPTAAHKAIAELAKEGYIRVILTTNFDRLLEDALADHGVRPDVISSDDMVQSALPLQHSPITIIKLHGDYRDWRSLNTTEELAEYKPEKNQLLDRVLDEYGLVVCGWSADWDIALRDAIYRTPNRRFTTFWAAYGDPSSRADELIHHRRAQVIKIADADSFFAEVEQTITDLASAQRVDPLSIPALVERTKRLIPVEDRYIELTELITGTTQRGFEGFTDDEFFQTRQVELAKLPQNGWPIPDFERIVGLYLEQSLPMLHVMAHLASFGKNNQSQHVVNVINRWLENPRNANEDFEVWRFLPATFLIYTIGIAATRHNNWEYLKCALTEPRMQASFRGPGPEKFLDKLRDAILLRTIEMLPGRTWLSDYVATALRPVLQPMIPSEVAYLNTLDLFEMILALTYLHTATYATNWMPVHNVYRNQRSHEFLKDFWTRAGTKSNHFALLNTELLGFYPIDLFHTLENYVSVANSFTKFPEIGSPPFDQIYKAAVFVAGRGWDETIAEE